MLALVVVFVLFAQADDQFRLLLGALIAACFCIVAFLLQWLTLDGSAAAFVIGTLTFGLGGWPAAVLLLLFFVSSSLISRKSKLIIEESSHEYNEEVRRTGLQVWSNGFWFSLGILLAFMTGYAFFWIAAAGAIATAMADTWATELGSKRFEVKTYLMNGLKKVEAGTEGGISVPGTLAAIAASMAMALAAVYFFSLKSTLFFPIFLAGFSGCLMDSYLGSTFQRTSGVVHIPGIHGAFKARLDNNMVNWLSTGTGSLLALILNLVLI